MNEPTYSQIEAALRAASPSQLHFTDANREWMKRALIAAQKVDQNIYGHLHYGFSYDGIVAQFNSQEARKRVLGWQWAATQSLPAVQSRLDEALAKLQDMKSTS